MAKLATTALIVALSLMVAGCGEEELYTGLSERDANAMAAVIETAGMDASKRTKDGKTWSLLTRRGDFADAVALLQARGYPREPHQSLGEIFKKQGFVSSQVEERARLNFGLSQELANTISNIDGVIMARVHLALPESDPLTGRHQPASASVFVKYDPRVNLVSQEGAIKALVVNSIESLPYDRVTVLMTPAQSVRLPENRPNRAAPEWLWALLAGVALASGAAALRVRRRRPEPEPAPEPVSASEPAAAEVSGVL